MNLYLRLVMTLLRSLFEPRMTTQQACVQWFRVWPNDIDAFGHMNNGRYLQIMDVARMRWLARTGTIAVAMRRRWSMSLGGNLTRYRRSLRLFARYCVSTRLVCWDQRWFYLEHAVLDGSSRPVAVGISRAAFHGDGRWITADTVMDEVDRDVRSPEMPPYLSDWLTVERAAFKGAFDDAPAKQSPVQQRREIGRMS